MEPDTLGLESQHLGTTLDKALALLSFNFACKISGNDCVSLIRFLEGSHDTVHLAEHLSHKKLVTWQMLVGSYQTLPTFMGGIMFPQKSLH